MQAIDIQKLKSNLIYTSPLALGIGLLKFKAPLHLRYINNILANSINQGNLRLIITLPPRHGKSELISRCYPTWAILRKPNYKILLSSYEASFASQWGIKARDMYKSVKNDLIIERQDFWQNSFGGFMQTAGIGGAMTGKGADIVIIDDPVKNSQEANSKIYRDKTYDWFTSVAYTRLEPNGNIIVMQTRWHEDDLAGRLIKSGEYHLINIPAIAKSDDVLGRDEGQALWSERYNIEKLNEIKKNVGTYWFNALYQQSPTTEENEKIKRKYWKFINSINDIDLTNALITQSWDTAFKIGEKNDFTVCTTWAKIGNFHYLIDFYRDRIEFPELERQVIKNFRKWKPDYVFIEDKASGQSLIQSLKIMAIQENMLIKPVLPKGDKNERVELILPEFDKGNIFILKEIWNETVINECAEFPFSAHDDIVDSITQNLFYVTKKLVTNVLVW